MRPSRRPDQLWIVRYDLGRSQKADQAEPMEGACLIRRSRRGWNWFGSSLLNIPNFSEGDLTCLRAICGGFLKTTWNGWSPPFNSKAMLTP
jgi:hypothetical protein